jgi:hypothetical protein
VAPSSTRSRSSDLASRRRCRARHRRIRSSSFAVDVGDAKVDTFDELRAFAEDIFRAAGRFRIVQAEIVPDRSLGVECVKADLVLEERQNPRNPGVVLELLIRPNFLCRHPHRPHDIFM